MNDDLSLIALDDRGRAAAAGVRADVATRPVPAFDPDVVRIAVDGRRPRRRTWGRTFLVAAVAAVVLAVVGIAVAAGRSVPDDAPADIVDPGPLDRFVLGEAPAGFALAGVRDEPVADADLLGTAILYGPTAAEPRLAVGLLATDGGFGTDCGASDGPGDERCDGGVDDETAGLDLVEVPGRRAWDVSSSFGPGAVVVAEGDRLVVVVGASLDAETLAAAAAGVTLDGGQARTDGLPDGYREVARAPLSVVVGPAAGIFGLTTSVAPTAAWSVWYGPTDPTDEGMGTLAVSTSPGTAVDVGLAGVAADEVRATTVRGHDAVLARLRVAGEETEWSGWSVRWMERPGEVVEVVAFGAGDLALTAEEVLALADEVVVVADDEVGDLDDAVADRGLDAPGVTVVGAGEFSDGTPWRLVHGLASSDLGGSGLTLRTSAASSGESSSSGSGVAVGSDGSASSDGGSVEVEAPDPEASPLGGEVSMVDGTAYSWAYGPVVGPEVTRVEVTVGDAEAVAATVVRSDDLGGWVAELPADVLGDGSGELVVVAYDAAGTEVDRLTL